jgi:hypothetical protein
MMRGLLATAVLAMVSDPEFMAATAPRRIPVKPPRKPHAWAQRPVHNTAEIEAHNAAIDEQKRLKREATRSAKKGNA